MVEVWCKIRTPITSQLADAELVRSALDRTLTCGGWKSRA